MASPPPVSPPPINPPHAARFTRFTCPPSCSLLLSCSEPQATGEPEGSASSQHSGVLIAKLPKQALSFCVLGNGWEHSGSRVTLLPWSSCLETDQEPLHLKPSTCHLFYAPYAPSLSPSLNVINPTPKPLSLSVLKLYCLGSSSLVSSLTSRESLLFARNYDRTLLHHSDHSSPEAGSDLISTSEETCTAEVL